MVVTAVLGARWNRQRGRPGFMHRALPTDAPTSAEMSSVKPYLRSGETAPDPELARLTVSAARELLRRWDNPWQTVGLCLVLGIAILNLLQVALNLGNWLPAGFAIAALALGIHLPLQRRRDLFRARRAIEANGDLAAEAPEAPAPPPPRER
ncbi:hypothetical protein [Nocardiopsis oceani]